MILLLTFWRWPYDLMILSYDFPVRADSQIMSVFSYVDKGTWSQQSGVGTCLVCMLPRSSGLF